MFNFQCLSCQKQFSQTIIHKWGKDERFFCQDCNEKNKNLCCWCEKVLPDADYWSKGKFCRVNKDGSREEGYENYCDEKCQSELWKYQENKPERIAERKKEEELLKQGYKPCRGLGPIPFLASLEKCGTLIPPTESFCEKCKKEQAREKEIREEWDRKNPEKSKVENEKHQKAQDWWNSLSKEQKQVEIKKLESEWIKKRGSDNFSGYYSSSESSIEFKNGRLYVYPEDLSKIPPPLLERFGIQVYSRGDIFGNMGKDFPGYNDNLDNKITELERELTLARQRNDQNLIQKLEREIKGLKDKKTNSSPSEANPLKKPLIICASGGVILVLLTLFAVLMFRKRKNKNPKNKL